MKGYGQFCPVAQALEVIGERWTLLVVRELLAGSERFSEIQRGVPLMSRSMLAQRLRALEDAGVLVRQTRAQGGESARTDGANGSAAGRGSGPRYRLTQAGEELRPIVEGCGAWGQRWVRRKLDAETLDAGLLMWDMRRNLVLEKLPRERTLVEFRLRGGGKGQRRYWLRIEEEDVDLCLTHPGFAVDLIVRADLRALTRVWMGELKLAQAMRAGDVELDGPAKLAREFPGWLKLSGFADKQ